MRKFFVIARNSEDISISKEVEHAVGLVEKTDPLLLFKKKHEAEQYLKELIDDSYQVIESLRERLKDAEDDISVLLDEGEDIEMLRGRIKANSEEWVDLQSYQIFEVEMSVSVKS